MVTIFVLVSWQGVALVSEECRIIRDPGLLLRNSAAINLDLATTSIRNPSINSPCFPYGNGTW